ncbi:MAG: prepilin-type N-terminal cleavage/methylation domain-containing protein [Patescibacteria group bacterium]
MNKVTCALGRGFTLIELLVVVSIISLLSSLVLSALSSARLKAYDGRKIADFRSISTALTLFHEQFNRYPYNYLKWDHISGHYGAYDPTPDNINSDSGACDAPAPGAPGADPSQGAVNNLEPNSASQAYNASMKELVDAGFLGAIPHSIPGSSGYCYYNWSADYPTQTQGAVLMTTLQTGAPTQTGPYNSCRFSGVGWCSPDSASRAYCLCHSPQ